MPFFFYCIDGHAVDILGIEERVHWLWFGI
ncbi:hypothetical protein MAMMFC1_03550 [Methylomusa anaerophila]|uniref:Uncharacterized protein n=1 Tax=Methylomusa anaerophila TaxID=1930071 RepID=A0A348AP44_9FIRM|nr:hypothetical protein MAMMFC1_03550 [Methylomusa anaerophila]